MTNKFKFLLSGVVACTLCASVAFADTAATAPAAPAPASVAVVDVQAVVNASPAVQALKKEQEANAKDLITFIEKARKDVAATTDEKKKKSLEEKYNKELVSKREKYEKAYTSKINPRNLPKCNDCSLGFVCSKSCLHRHQCKNWSLQFKQRYGDNYR